MSPADSLTLRDKVQLLSASEIERTLVRLAHEIVEKNDGVQNLALVGIRRRGIPPVPVGTLDITLYRDDLSPIGTKPEVKPKSMECEITGKDVILVDDVLYTGRTIRAALDALFDCGRPRKVQLLVLIDRGHRELPIEAAFVGRRVQTTLQEQIEVMLQETDQVEKVMLVERA
jgi:pyrimidine operon attenuation protein/uracil phosphoribosyltransferase